MCIFYQPGKANVVVDCFRSLSIGSTTDFEEGKTEIAKDMHKLGRLEVTLMDFI